MYNNVYFGVLNMKKQEIFVGKQIVNYGKELWNKYFYNSDGLGQIIKQWQFDGKKPHAKQIMKTSVSKNGDRKISIATCFAGFKEGEKPFFKETLTISKNGEKKAQIFGIMNGKTYYAAGVPGAKNVQNVCNIAYRSNPEAKSYIFSRF